MKPPKENNSRGLGIPTGPWDLNLVVPWCFCGFLTPWNRQTKERTHKREGRRVGSSYISHFICSYNLNYNFRPLRGPSIILIIFHRLRSKYMRKQMVVFNAATKRNKTAMVPHNKIVWLYICLDLWKPCSPQHNHPDSFPRNYRVFSNRSATGSLTTHSLLTQLACDWLAGFQPLSLQGMTDKGYPAKKISSFPKQNASLCDSPHPPRVNCWAFPLVPAGSQAPKLSTTTLHDGAPPDFRSTARASLPAIAGRQAKKFCSKVDTVLKNPDIY